jgi:outer membrane protein assembly factor BamA
VTTAFAAGTLAQLGPQSAWQETLAGRITDHNLFGAGKVLDLAIVGVWPVGGGGGEEYATRLEYLDPQLFDTRKLFLTVGAFYSHTSFSFPSGLGVDFSVGMHLSTYTYATLGYRYLYQGDASGNRQYLTSDGLITTLSTAPGGALLATIGRNTEDDPFFPTHGWLLHAYGALRPGDPQQRIGGVVLRGTWRAGANSFWTFQARPFDDFRSLFDDDFGVSIVYSHTLFADTQADGGRRARWFVGPGVTDLRDPIGNYYHEIGVKAGVRLETRALGTVNVYVIATRLLRGGY